MATDFGFQNSENLSFGIFPFLGTGPTSDATYLITLYVAGPLVTDAPGAEDLGTVEALVIVGDGGTTPLPAALPLFASGLGVFGFIAARRKRKPVAA